MKIVRETFRSAIAIFIIWYALLYIDDKPDRYETLMFAGLINFLIDALYILIPVNCTKCESNRKFHQYR